MSKIHTLKLPLLVEDSGQAAIRRRMHAHGMLYNALLLGYVSRIDTYRASPISGLRHTKANQKKKDKLKTSLGLSKFDVLKLAHEIAKGSKNSLYDGLTVNETATRAFKACQDYLKTGNCQPEIKNAYHNHTVMGAGVSQNLRLVVKTPKSVRRLSQLEYEALKIGGIPREAGEREVAIKEAHRQWLALPVSERKPKKWPDNPRVARRQYAQDDLRQQVANIYNLYLSWTGRNSKQELLFKIDWDKLSIPRREYFLANLQALAQVGITREMVKGKWRYYALIVLNGPAYRAEDLSFKAGNCLAIDTGPRRSHGIDSDNQAIEITPGKEFVEKYQKVEAKIKAKQRRLDKTRRTNPAYKDNYNTDGTINKGVKFDPTKRSNNAKRLGQDIYELNRKRCAMRDELIRGEIKDLVRNYDAIVMEKINYSVWQRRYGKSMLMHTPGLFQRLLGMELARHDKELVILPLRYAFSKTCICGHKLPKPLSNRKHVCENKKCPIYQKEYHRDQYSAFLMLACYKYQLKPDDLHAGKLLACLSKQAKLLASSVSDNTRATIETNLLLERMLPQTLDQARISNKAIRNLSRLEPVKTLDNKDVVICDTIKVKQSSSKQKTSSADIYHK